MLKKLKHKKSIIFLLLFIVFIFLINSIVSSIIGKKLTELLLKNNSKYYTASVENVEFKLIRRSVTLKDIFLNPTNESISDLKNRKSSKQALEKISISSVNLKGISLFQLIFQNYVEINTLIVNDLLIQKFENLNILKENSAKKKPLNIDSIYIEKLNGFQIDKIKFNNFKYQVFDFSTDKITFQNNPISLEFSGFKLEKYQDRLFKLKPVENLFKIKKINLDFEDIKYQFLVDAVSINFEKKIIHIEKLHLKPSVKKNALANTYKFNKEVFDVYIENLKIYNYDFAKTLNKEGIFVDSISVSGLDLDIYKDKRKPFDLDKRPKLPHIALKQMETPIHINKIKINSGNFKLENRLEKRDVSMKISINDIDAQITNITSIKKFRVSPLKVDVKAKFMKSAEMHVNINFPLKDHQNTFYFNGSLGQAKLHLFDTALFPILGLKVLKGDLDGLTFSANANDISSSGKMTLLYHDLEAEVFKANSLDENKFLSWIVNNVVKESNPGHNDKVREAEMHFNRVEYKGFGNYFWKTLQGGIINTIAPFGNKTDDKKEKRKN